VPELQETNTNRSIDGMLKKIFIVLCFKVYVIIKYHAKGD
jgi:hypothetical protein